MPELPDATVYVEALERFVAGPPVAVQADGRLADGEWRRLFEATREVLVEWIERSRREVGDGFPRRACRCKMAMNLLART